MTQLFRDGAMEGVDASGIPHSPKRIPTRLDSLIVRHARDYVRTLRAGGIDVPLAVFVSLLGVRDFKMGPPSSVESDDGSEGFDRDDILVPEVWIEGPDATAEDLRPALDVLWQAAGHDRCPRYDEQGKWIPQESDDW